MNETETHHINIQIRSGGIRDRVHDGHRMITGGELRSSEEDLLEKVRGRVPGVEVLYAVEGDVKLGMTGPLGAEYPDRGPVEGD